MKRSSFTKILLAVVITSVLTVVLACGEDSTLRLLLLDAMSEFLHPLASFQILRDKYTRPRLKFLVLILILFLTFLFDTNVMQLKSETVAVRNGCLYVLHDCKMIINENWLHKYPNLYQSR